MPGPGSGAIETTSRAASWIQFPEGKVARQRTICGYCVGNAPRRQTKTSEKTCRIALKQAGSRQGIKRGRESPWLKTRGTSGTQTWTTPKAREDRMSHERHNIFVHLAKAEYPLRCAVTYPRVSSPADTTDSPLHSRRQDAGAPAAGAGKSLALLEPETENQATAKRNAQSRL
jgi:hypothetical protein